MIRAHIIRLDGRKAGRDILVKGGDDGDLGDVFDLVGLRVGVCGVVVLVVVVQPVGGGG